MSEIHCLVSSDLHERSNDSERCLGERLGEIDLSREDADYQHLDRKTL